MSEKKLTGIERELVLKYLIDGNVPVTITPILEKKDSSEIKSVETLVLPVLVRREKMAVLKEGIIFLQNVPESIKILEDKEIKVEFYFNRVGLFFNSVLKFSKSGAYILIPSEIERIDTVETVKKFDFSAILYYSVDSNKDLNFLCYPKDGFDLFTKPVWSSINLENQKKAKEYLEKFVEKARITKAAGTGIQLINICKYLVENSSTQITAVENLIEPFDILFVDHERIVLAYKKNDSVFLDSGKEYALKMSFAVNETKAFYRDVFVTFKVSALYSDDENQKFCADCNFTTIQNEDIRFLYEKTSKSLFV